MSNNKINSFKIIYSKGSNINKIIKNNIFFCSKKKSETVKLKIIENKII